MLKKIFKVLTTVTLLAGCYFGYVHGFAIVVEQLKAIKHTDTLAFPIHDSKSLQDSIRYAAEVCGPGHWATDRELAYRYYNAERGYWIYAKECIRVREENGVRYDGKRMRMKPFLLITKSRDGKNTKMITADRAVFDLSAPLGFDANSGREPLKIKHAHLEPNVVIRDDKGTPQDSSDDMYTDPITTVDYEESTQLITTEPDTHVVMREPGKTTTGDGLIIQLRKLDATAGGASSGFDGVESLILLKSVHIMMADVGESNMIPGPASVRKTGSKKSQTEITIAGDPTQQPQQPAKPAKPVPLDLTCDSKMQIVLPRSKLPVLVGPPELPLPTLARFERNVVVLRGDPNDQPDQLTCDTLKLTLLPAAKPGQGETPIDASKPKSAEPTASLAQSSLDRKAIAGPGTSGGTSQDPLGGLTLQRLHATGHAVWLILPTNGIKLRCNEMMHARQLPFKPDMTYFRGDRTRPVEIVKIDVERAEDDGEDEQKSPQEPKIVSVTNIWAEDVTLLDSGGGMDTADVYAHGPGRLETRPDRDQPVERIAIWQDTLIVKNVLGRDNEILHKVVDLTGNRPCFIDNLQKTSLDSASWIQVWLKPKPTPPKPLDQTSQNLAQHAGDGQNRVDSIALANANSTPPSSVSSQSPAGKDKDPGTSTSGSNLQIEQLHALFDVHLLAPSKTMTARDRFDAEFVEAEAPHVTSNGSAKANASSASDTPMATDAPAANPIDAQSQEQVASEDQAENPSEDPPMIGSCNRLWARIALKSESETNGPPRKQSTKTQTAAVKPKKGETNAEIRKVWMYGNVALHQDPKKDDVKESLSSSSTHGGTDASGEALYLDNRGPNLAITYVYQRDPTETNYLPGPLPPACIDSKDKDPKRITAAGSVRLNQETDQAWVIGPGTITQLTARAFFSDKAPGTDEGSIDNAPDADTEGSSGRGKSQVKIRSTSMVRDDTPDRAPTSSATETNTKPKTRAGVLLSQKVPMTIGFSEKMEFTGRSVDPEQRPAAHADFHGVVTALMEDALLHCTARMIAFTDREVPLTQLGKKSRTPSPGAAGSSTEIADSEAEPQAELSLIYCYQDAVGISRKVHPDYPEPIQQQRIEADKILAYDRRTGDFYIPGRGKVFLYDQSNDSSSTPASGMDDSDEPDSDGSQNPDRARSERRVTQTSGSTPNGDHHNTKPKTSASQNRRRPVEQRLNNEAGVGVQPMMILTQIYFNNGMRGRFGTGKENDKTESRWSEFHGNVETCRAKVANTNVRRLDADHLPADGVYMTGQMLRVIQEPAPVGSPETTPARQYLKVWENAQARNHTKIIKADVITYDSYKDLVYAYGEDGHPVLYAEQHAAGQPVSNGSAEAVKLNPKTGGIHLINSNTVGLIDKNTGFRPTVVGPDDPYAKQKKRVKRPFKLPTMNVERRGWTGQ